MKHLVHIFLLLPFVVLSQDKGIQFEKVLSWPEIKAMAAAEQKYIFVDCVTSWCAPCKEMSKNVFSLPEVGNFFNDRFISIQVQMDRTPADDELVKKWYADADSMAKAYNVLIYPTFLYFSPDGTLVHRIVGGSRPVEFITRSSEALEQDKQYHTQLRAFENAAVKTANDYRKWAILTRDVFDGQRALKFATSYQDMVKDYFTKEGVQFLDKFTNSSKDKHFALFIKEKEKIDRIMGDGYAARKTERIIIQEEVYPLIPREGIPDWSGVQQKVALKYPALAASAVARFQIMYFTRMQDWENFRFAVRDYINKYGIRASAEDLNSYARAAFESSVNTPCLEEASEWCKLAIVQENDNPEFRSTYAAILYKLGKRKQAMQVQQEAVKMANESTKHFFKNTLVKMSNGEDVSVF